MAAWHMGREEEAESYNHWSTLLPSHHQKEGMAQPFLLPRTQSQCHPFVSVCHLLVQRGAGGGGKGCVGCVVCGQGGGCAWVGGGGLSVRPAHVPCVCTKFVCMCLLVHEEYHCHSCTMWVLG